jgi:hypothetical protein
MGYASGHIKFVTITPHTPELGQYVYYTRWGTPLAAGALPGSDNGHYVAHSLALRNEIRTWYCIEKGAITKNDRILLPNPPF